METEAYLEPCQTYIMELFCKNSYQFLVVNYFCKKALIYVRQYALNTLLKSRTSQIDLSLTLFSFWFLMFFMFWIVLVFKQIYEFGDSLDLKFWVQQYSNPSSHSVFPKTPKTLDCHYVKSVHILSYSGPHFPAFGLNTDRY